MSHKKEKAVMKTLRTSATLLLNILPAIIIMIQLSGCSRDHHDDMSEVVSALQEKGLHPEIISAEQFYRGQEPQNFFIRTGAAYKPSYNEDPAIPAQCWIETGYGTQNACQYCHTDYLATIGHGNAFPIADDQILYSFPTPNLNRILWRNVIFPEEIEQRLKDEGIPIPSRNNFDYVRQDNWSNLYARVRDSGNGNWLHAGKPEDPFALFPALNPRHLFPYNRNDPTGNGKHGYIDPEGFVRDEQNGYTGWRAVNFFPYAIFTPLTGSVSGIYIRLPRPFMTENDEFDVEVYKMNLDLLERNIKNRSFQETRYYGDASSIPVKKGFYPVSTEFAHPLHYVDLYADGEAGNNVNGVVGNTEKTYEFPGTRSKRVKEIRYMYKWKEVDLEDIAEDENDDHEFEMYVGGEGQGWVENGSGWILAGFIEDRHGNLRPQTTEEMVQCIGCHGNVGNTVDAVWSFQRKLPGDKGWGEMDYGEYRYRRSDRTKLQDYMNIGTGMGELQYFYYTVVGADLYGVMPAEITRELVRFSQAAGLERKLNLEHAIDEIFNDELLKNMTREDRKSRLSDRQRIMRYFAEQKEYLYNDRTDDAYYVKGTIFYPSEETMKNNIHLYRKIVLDQSYNLGKDVFGAEQTHIPFTFRSDGTVKDGDGNLIPAGNVITSRPFGPDGEGTTPTGIVGVNDNGEPIDMDGNIVEIDAEPERVVGHITTGGTFNPLYNPIPDDEPVRR
jgi:hypothetical protein